MSKSTDENVVVLGQIGRPSFKHGAIYELSLDELVEMLVPHLPQSSRVVGVRIDHERNFLLLLVHGSPEQGFEMVPEGHPYPCRAFEVET